MIDIELPYQDAIPTIIAVGGMQLCLPLPIHGYCPLKIYNSTADLDCFKSIPQCDDQGNRHSDILRQDWTYRFNHQEAIAGSLNLHIFIQMSKDTADLLNPKQLRTHLITLFEAREAFARNIKEENASWTDEPLDLTPTYLFPKTIADFSEASWNNHIFHLARMGGPHDDIRPLHYYWPIRDDAYVCLSFAPEGFSQENFASQQAREDFLRSLIDDFMQRIKITADHPVSA